MITTDKILETKRQIEKDIINIKETLKTFPRKNIYATRNGKYTKWYIAKGHDRQYIPTKEKELIQKLTLKKYYQDELNKLLLQKQAIDNYLSQFQTYSKKHPPMLDSSSLYYPVMMQHFETQDEYAKQWHDQPFEPPIDKYNNHTKTTVLKEKVISKSEQQIADFLWSNNIPYKYECPLQLGNIIVHPDFTILHPRTHEIYYWEHMGMMDSKNYYYKNCNKIKDYCDNGIYPGDHLILTFETNDNSIDSSEVQFIIKKYFLN